MYTSDKERKTALRRSSLAYDRTKSGFLVNKLRCKHLPFLYEVLTKEEFSLRISIDNI